MAHDGQARKRGIDPKTVARQRKMWSVIQPGVVDSPAVQHPLRSLRQQIPGLAWSNQTNGYKYAMKSSLGKKSSIALVVVLLCAACGSSQNKQSDPAPSSVATSTTAEPAQTQQATAQNAAESLKRSIPQIVRLIPVTEDNDGNNLIGRPNGYSAATAVVDSRLPACENPGADCGAMIEQWPDEAAAQRRAEYIQTIAKAAPVLANEYDTVKGNLLLRVAGDLKPSAAEAYKKAFMR